jgi:hypothetical protein
MTDTEAQITATAALDDAGLPTDPVERRAELDRLIAAGEADMNEDIDAWHADKQRKADHLVLLQEREAIGDVDLNYYTTASEDDLRAVQAKLAPALAEMEELMKRDYRGYHDKSNADARALYRRIIEINSKISQRLK